MTCSFNTLWTFTTWDDRFFAVKEVTSGVKREQVGLWQAPTQRARCPRARTELSFFERGRGRVPSVGCCGDEKPFHPAVFQSSLRVLITGPGAALWARCASCRLLRKSRASDSHHTRKNNNTRRAESRARPRTSRLNRSVSPATLTFLHSADDTGGVSGFQSCPPPRVTPGLSEASSHLPHLTETFASAEAERKPRSPRNARVGHRRRWETFTEIHDGTESTMAVDGRPDYSSVRWLLQSARENTTNGRKLQTPMAHESVYYCSKLAGPVCQEGLTPW